MQLVFLWLSDEKNKRCCNRCHRDHISGITRREAKSTDQQQILQTLCASIPRRNARYPVGIFTLLWFSLEAWMFCMCGHWSGGVYLLGLVMPEASLSVLLARALEVRAVDCDKERRENEWNLLIWNVVSIRKEILHYSQFSATVMEYEQAYNKVCTKPQFRVTLWNNKHPRWQVWLCSLPLFFKKRQLIRESLQFSSRLPVFPFNGQIQNDTFERIHFSPRGTPAASSVAFWKDGRQMEKHYFTFFMRPK